MSKTKALRREIQRYLKTVTPNVYYEKADESGKYPHIVFELSELSHNDGKTILQLETNVIGYGSDTGQIEDIADGVQTIFHNYHFINDEIQFSTYKNRRETVKEEDKKIIRRRILFEVHLHELKGE